MVVAITGGECARPAHTKRHSGSSSPASSSISPYSPYSSSGPGPCRTAEVPYGMAVEADPTSSSNSSSSEVPASQRAKSSSGNGMGSGMRAEKRGQHIQPRRLQQHGLQHRLLRHKHGVAAALVKGQGAWAPHLGLLVPAPLLLGRARPSAAAAAAASRVPLLLWFPHRDGPSFKLPVKTIIRPGDILDDAGPRHHALPLGASPLLAMSHPPSFSAPPITTPGGACTSVPVLARLYGNASDAASTSSRSDRSITGDLLSRRTGSGAQRRPAVAAAASTSGGGGGGVDLAALAAGGASLLSDEALKALGVALPSHCCGCGMRLQRREPEAPGFFVIPSRLLEPEAEAGGRRAAEEGGPVQAVEAARREMDEAAEADTDDVGMLGAEDEPDVLCQRCFSLKHSGKVRVQAAETALPDFDLAKKARLRTAPNSVWLQPMHSTAADAPTGLRGRPTRTASDAGPRRAGVLLLLLMLTLVLLLTLWLGPAAVVRLCRTDRVAVRVVQPTPEIVQQQRKLPPLAARDGGGGMRNQFTNIHHFANPLYCRVRAAASPVPGVGRTNGFKPLAGLAVPLPPLSYQSEAPPALLPPPPPPPPSSLSLLLRGRPTAAAAAAGLPYLQGPLAVTSSIAERGITQPPGPTPAAALAVAKGRSRAGSTGRNPEGAADPWFVAGTCTAPLCPAGSVGFDVEDDGGGARKAAAVTSPATSPAACSGSRYTSTAMRSSHTSRGPSLSRMPGARGATQDNGIIARTANAGKSSLINAMKRVAGTAGKGDPTVAPVPGTTLGLLQVPGMPLGPKHRAFDTPGVPHSHQLTSQLGLEEVKKVFEKPGVSCLLPKTQMRAHKEQRVQRADRTERRAEREGPGMRVAAPAEAPPPRPPRSAGGAGRDRR
ncbi:hypothetical protein TSOC_000567 [Tetrabaena socialis]|uniref:G domain-containing protein n=1 Tax=Tetrabaena socialis TaxID=47790 RepID=A0A2J8AJ21_9CHLO|nr:hypothetical protein TSOC_000567 [Tetrabaena socialis]|eukprot:PNH12511.1 hypothetical protein TSOC_000567 [Tetrabaena socialis]